MVKNFSKLYVNGCSFTAGDNIPEGATWPELLANDLKYTLINSSRNGNSLDTIKLISIVDLAKLDPAETFVIIGLTWKERYGLLLNKFTANITPADLDKDAESFPEKLSTYRRVSSLYINDPVELSNLTFKYSKSKEMEGFDKTLLSFKEYYLNLIRYDNSLEINQSFSYIANIISLQSYLEANNFSYRMIDFPEYFTGVREFRRHEYKDLISKVNTKKIINMGWSTIGSGPDSTAHPNIEQCQIINNLIKYRL